MVDSWPKSSLVLTIHHVQFFTLPQYHKTVRLQHVLEIQFQYCVLTVFCVLCSVFNVLCSHSTPFAAEPRPNAVPALRQDSRWQRLRNQPLIELYTTALLPLQFYNIQTIGTLYMV